MLQYIVGVAPLPTETGMTDFQAVTVVVGFVVGTIAFLVNIIAVFIAVYRLGRAVEKFENIGTQQANEIAELKKAVTTVATLVTELSLQQQRMDTIEKRQNQQHDLIEDLRRGNGYILPPSVSPHEVAARLPSTPSSR